MIVFVVCLLVRLALGQSGPEVAYDLFNYNYNVSGSFKSTSGGVGLKQTWKEQAGTEFGCDVLRFVGNLTKPTNIVYASPQDSVMVGSAYSGSKYCAIARGFAGAPFGTSSGVMYVSVLFMSLFQSVTNKDGAFAVAVGDDATVAKWDPEQNNLYISGTAVIAVRAIRHLQAFTIQMSGGGAQQQFTSINPATGPFAVLLVVRYEWSDQRRVTARFFPFDLINGTRDVNDMHVLAAPTSSYTLDTPKLTSISMATYRFHAAQVRVGSTFNSVYADVPSQLTTPVRTTTTTTTIASGTSTSTTSTSTSRGAASTTTTATPPTTTSSTSRSTQAPSVSPASATSTSDSSSVSLSQGSESSSSSPVTCDAAASCGTCLAVSGCRWCSRGRHVESGECTATPGDDCVLLTQSAVGCNEEPADNAMDDESLPVATIAGAVGGSIAALLLIGAIVGVVYFRSRRNSGSDAPQAQTSVTDAGSVEMATTREAPSVTISTDSNNSNATYGDLRLTALYSAAGLAPAGTATTTSPTPSQYTEMEMK